MLAGKHPARAPYSGLDLIEYQQDAVAVTQIAQTLEETVRRGQVSPLTLNRLHQYGCALACPDPAGEQHVFYVTEPRLALIGTREQRPVQVGVWHVGDTRHGRKEAGLLGVFARREGERAHRAAVEPPQKGNEARPACHVACELEGALDRLG